MFYARKSIFHDFVSLRMEISVPRDRASYPQNTVIPRVENFYSHPKPMQDTYSHIRVYNGKCYTLTAHTTLYYQGDDVMM